MPAYSARKVGGDLVVSWLTFIAEYKDWTIEETRHFLKSQGIKVKHSDTLEQLQKQVEKHGDAAASVSGISSGRRLTSSGHRLRHPSQRQRPLTRPIQRTLVFLMLLSRAGASRM